MPRQRYTATAVCLHWTIAVLVLINSALALFRETFAPWAVEMITAHKVIGLLTVALSLVLLAWRLFHPPPVLPAGIRRWEARLAKTVHNLLYLLMVAVPLAGWIFVSLAPETRPLDYRGLPGVPELALPEQDEASFFWHEVHELAGFAMIGLFLLHIAAALKHQIVDRIDILGRMLPGRNEK